MLANRTANQSSAFSIPLEDDAGNRIDATAARWELFDDRGTSISTAEVDDFDGSGDAVQFTVSGTALNLTAGITSAGREMVIYLTTEGGEVELRDYFLLVARNPLALMVNSFMTYPEALALRMSFGPVLDGWDVTLDTNTRSAALAQSFEHLLRMAYRLPWLQAQDHAQSYAAYGTGTDDIWDTSRRVRLRGISLETFDALPADFRSAIKRAQLVEANILLGGDVVGRKRKEGIISETIGESSTFFSSKPYLNLPVSRQAFEEVKRFVIFRVGIARA